MEEPENEEELLFKPPVSVQYRCPRLPPCGTDALRAIVCLPTWQFCKDLCMEPRKVPFFKVSSSPHRAGKVVMGASRSQAGGTVGGVGARPQQGWGGTGQGLCTQWGDLSLCRWSGAHPS